MQLRINSAVLGLLVILLANKANSEVTQKKLEETAFNNLQSFLELMPDPIGNILTIVPSTFFSFYASYQDAQNISTRPAALENDFLDEKEQSELLDAIIEQVFRQKDGKVIIYGYVPSDDFYGFTNYWQIIDKLQYQIELLIAYVDDWFTKCLLQPTCESPFTKYESDQLLPFRMELERLFRIVAEQKNNPRGTTRTSRTVYDYIIDRYRLKILSSTDCNNGASEHKKVYDLSIALMALVTKCYSTIIAVHFRMQETALQQNNKEVAQSHILEALDTLADYEEFINTIVTSAGSAFYETSRDIRPCDPPEHIRNVTWDRLTTDLSVQKFSTQNVVASPGYVITGIKWLIKNETIYLEIQEGKFVNGSIDSTTVRWKETPEDETQTVTVDHGLHLNEIVLPPNALLTGVKFELAQGVSFRAEGIVTDSTGIELTEEKVMVHTRLWDYMNTGTNELVNIDGRDLPELAPHESEHDVLRNTDDTYISFTTTNSGQTTIPYLDIQPVITNPPAPLGGIGMYYKGMPGYGGFVGIKLLSADVRHKIDSETIEKYFDEVNSIYKKYKN